MKIGWTEYAEEIQFYSRADRVAPSSSVVGLDAHAAMLTLARAKNDAGTVQTGKKRSISKITNAQQAQMVSIK